MQFIAEPPHLRTLLCAVCLCFGNYATAESKQPLPAGCVWTAKTPAARHLIADTTFPPIQLEIRNLFAPTLVKSHDGQYLIYELRLQNYTEHPLGLNGLNIVDAANQRQLVASINQQDLATMIQAVGTEQLIDHQLPAGQSAVVYLCLAFAANQQVPMQLKHQVSLQQGSAAGPAMMTRNNQLKTISRPVAGRDWIPANGPSLHSHHRTGLLFTGGVSQLARRFAIDWKIIKNDVQFDGDALDPKSYFAYGRPVLAVADGVVVAAKDGFPDNTPKTAAGFATALPVTMDNLAGNTVILDLGQEQYAHYAHLQPGSVRVKAGDKVTRGTVLANIGNSGDSRWPHLHFQISTAADILASEGLPFLIDHYRTKSAADTWYEHNNEFPMGDILIDFGLPENPAITK